MESIKLDALLDVIGELFSDEISIAVTNTKEYIYYRPSKRVDLKIKTVDPVKPGTIASKTRQLCTCHTVSISASTTKAWQCHLSMKMSCRDASWRFTQHLPRGNQWLP